MKTIRWTLLPLLACLVAFAAFAGPPRQATSTSTASKKRSYKPRRVFVITLDLASAPPASDIANYACQFTYNTTGGSQTDAWDFVSAKQHGNSNTVTLKFLARRTVKPKDAAIKADNDTTKQLTGTGNIVISFPTTATIPATDPIPVEDVGADPCDDN